MLAVSGSRSGRRTVGGGVLAAIALAAIVLAAAGCGDGSAGSGESGKPVIVATTGIWADVTANVACEGTAEVVPLVPPGADPHAFEPSLADRATLGAAALVVANGLGLEAGLEDSLAALGTETPVLRMGDHVDTIPYTTDGDHDEGGDDHDDGGDDHDDGGDDHDDGGGDHDDGGADPHVWFDPVRVSDALGVLADRLVADAGLDREVVDACLDEYRMRLADVDDRVAAILEVVPADRRLLVTNHDSLGYLADRYGFEVVGTVIPTPSGLAETNPAQLAELADLIRTTGVPAIFAEEQHSTSDAEAVAGELGDVAVVTLTTGSLGAADRGPQTYVDLLTSNAELIAAALR